MALLVTPTVDPHTHAHYPGTVVEVNPAEEVWSTCPDCGTSIVRRYENAQDEDRIAGWGRWKPATVVALV